MKINVKYLPKVILLSLSFLIVAALFSLSIFSITQFLTSSLRTLVIAATHAAFYWVMYLALQKGLHKRK